MPARPEGVSSYVLNMKGEDGLLDLDAIADTTWHLHTQHRTAPSGKSGRYGHGTTSISLGRHAFVKKGSSGL